jgi:hypothetical protein
MKYNLSRHVQTVDGGYVMKPTPGGAVPMTAAEIISQAVLLNPPHQVLSLTESMERYELAKRLKGAAELELDAGEVKLIEGALPLLGQPWVTGEICTYLNSATADDAK